MVEVLPIYQLAHHIYIYIYYTPAPPKGWLKPYKQLDKLSINWCRIFSNHRIITYCNIL